MVLDFIFSFLLLSLSSLVTNAGHAPVKISRMSFKWVLFASGLERWRKSSSPEITQSLGTWSTTERNLETRKKDLIQILIFCRDLKNSGFGC